MILRIILALFLGGIILTIISWRVVVPTDEYHIIQSANKTIEYGRGKPAGNVYYNVPSFIPKFGITRKVMSAVIFDVMINRYEAFDKGRVPFYVDIAGFFRIEDASVASQKVSSLEELHQQLQAIVASVARTILAKMDINEVLESRAELGDMFMSEISQNIAAFGLVCTKNVELMKIYDVENSSIISNIQKKRESEIDRDAKIAIAQNIQKAESEKIEAARIVALKEAQKQEEVGKKQAEAYREIELAEEKRKQDVQEAMKLSAEKELAVKKVQEVQLAEIAKQKKIIEEEQAKQVKIIQAEAQAQELRELALGRKEAAENDATAVKVRAEAEAEFIQKKALAEAEGEAKKKEATIADQVALMDKMEKNKEYAAYLQAIKAIEMYGKAEQLKAEALSKADIKFLSTGKNELGEFLGKMGLGLETLEDLKGPEKIKDLIKGFVDGFKNKESEPEVLIEAEDDKEEHFEENTERRRRGRPSKNR